MSEQNWTPEPWNYDDGRLRADSMRPMEAIRLNGASLATGRVPPDDVAHANSRRIATCVNACTGTPSTIQPKAVKAMAEALENLLAGYLHATTDDEGFVIANRDVAADARAALALYNGDQGDKP